MIAVEEIAEVLLVAGPKEDVYNERHDISILKSRHFVFESFVSVQ